MTMETMIISAILPAAIDGVKNLINKVTGSVKPRTVDEQIKLDNANVQRLEAMAKLDNPYGTPSQWVIDLRASFRYIAAGIVIGCAAVSLFVPGLGAAIQLLAFEAASVAFSFVFGERLYLGLVGKK